MKGLDAAIKALLNYVKQQSKMTLLELEREFTPRKEDNRNMETNASHGGRQWWRWIHGITQPRIEVVEDVFKFASDQLIRGCWEENGSESQWVDLLPAVIDQRLSFLIEKKEIFLKILGQLHEPQFPQSRNSLVTANMLRAISADYYLPRDEGLREIFWSKPDELDAVYANNEYIPWYRIISENSDEKNEMDILMTGILVNLGISATDRSAIEAYAINWGLKGNQLASWADQVHQQILVDAQLLSDIEMRMSFLYPSESKWADDLDDTSASHAKQSHLEAINELATAAKRFQGYSEKISSMSESSRQYGLFTQMLSSHYKIGGDSNRAGWRFPAVEIL